MLKVSYQEVTPQRRGFHAKDADAVQNLENVGIAFLDGYHQSLGRDPVAFACRSMDQKNMHYRGFAYEGIAMGLVFKDLFRAGRKKQLPDFLSDRGNKHIYMAHVGIGWAYAKLPLPIEKVLPRYDPVLRWLIMDGYGFHEAYFKTKACVHGKKVPRLSPQALPVFYQGVGRCLWFVCGTAVANVAGTIATFPEKYHADLWAGVGLAAVYAGIVETDELLELKTLSGDHLPYLLQGAAFAAKARQRAGLVTGYTEKAVQALTGLAVSQAAEITDRALLRIEPGLESSRQYQSWRAMIAEELGRQVSAPAARATPNLEHR